MGLRDWTAEVIGLGSIGRRRARLLAEFMEVSGRDVVEWEPVAEGVVAATGPVGDADLVVVCTPPDERADVVREVLATGRAKMLFVEKPVASTAEELDALAALDYSGVRTFVACNMRYALGSRALYDFAQQEGVKLCLKMGMAEKYWSAGHTKIPIALDSIHEFDLAQWANGEIVGIEYEISTMDEFVGVCHHADGSETQIELNRSDDPPERYWRPEWVPGFKSGVLDTGDADMMYRREMTCAVRGGELGENPIEDAITLTRKVLSVCP